MAILLKIQHGSLLTLDSNVLCYVETYIKDASFISHLLTFVNQEVLLRWPSAAFPYSCEPEPIGQTLEKTFFFWLIVSPFVSFKSVLIHFNNEMSVECQL